MSTVAHESSVRGWRFKHRIRYGLVLLGTAAAFGCDGDRLTDSGMSPGSIPEPGYSLTVSAPTLQTVPASGSANQVSLARTGSFTGSVALSVENLPTGVSVDFSPASPVSGSRTEMAVRVAGEAPTGTFNLLVRGVAAGLPDRTAPLTLKIITAPLVLTLSSSTLSLMQGTVTTTVNLLRNDFADPVTLWVDTDFHGTMPRGVTATFAPNPTTGTRSLLTLSVDGAATPGVYDLWVYGLFGPTGETGSVEAPLRLTIPATPSP